MTIKYGDYITSLIPNATMQVVLRDGELFAYSIQAEEGYVLHDNRIDVPVLDEETLEETGEIIPWFKTGSTTVPANYDFDNVTSGTYTYSDENGMTVNVSVQKIGMYEFYTVEIELTSKLNELPDGVN